MDLMVNTKDEFWRNVVNNLDEVVPKDGRGPPQMEAITTKKKSKENGNRKVLVQKIITQIYVFTDADGKVFASQASQSMHILGQMTLEEGLKRAQEDKST